MGRDALQGGPLRTYASPALMARRVFRSKAAIAETPPVCSSSTNATGHRKQPFKQTAHSRDIQRSHRHLCAAAANWAGAGHHHHDDRHPNQHHHHSHHNNGHHHDHEDHDHHHHDHDHGHDHEHHHYPDNWLTRAMQRVGLVQLASRIEHSGALAVASILFFVLSLVASLPPVASLLSERGAAALRAACLGGTYLLSGLPQAVSSAALAASGRLDTHVLMALAVAATLYLGMASEGALLMLLFQVSHFLEEKFTSRAQGSLERLFASMPERATLVSMTEPHPAAASSSSSSSSSVGPDLSTCVEVVAEEVAVGQLVLVRPGEQVPLDGEVAWGVAAVSAAHISGEAAPARVGPGDWVPAGALSADGALVVRVTAGAADSTPARIARMATQARASKPQLERLLDRISSLWGRGVVAATVVSLLALLAAGVPPLAAPGGAVYRALGVLVAGSPCAVVLVPLAYVCAMAAVTRRGVLLKGASALDALAFVGTVALDKTGTLTTGQLRLTEATLLDYYAGVTTTTATTTTTTISADGSHSATQQQQRQPGSPMQLSLLPLLQAGGGAGADACAAPPAGLAVSPGGGLVGNWSDSGGSVSESEWEADQLFMTGATGAAADRGPSSGAGAAAAAAAGGVWGEVVVRCAAALSRASTHPVSRAVAEAGGGLARGVSVSGFEQVPGSGVRGVCRLHGRAFAVAFGSPEFAIQELASQAANTEAATAAPSGTAAAEHLRAFLYGSGSAGATPDSLADSNSETSSNSSGGGGGSVGLLGGGVSAVKAVSLLVVTPLLPQQSGASSGAKAAAVVPRVALFSFEDVVRPGVPEAVAALRGGGWRRRWGQSDRGNGAGASAADEEAAMRVVMLTGDNPSVAASVAASLGISDFRAAMMPGDKLDFVRREQQKREEEKAAGHMGSGSGTPAAASSPWNLHGGGGRGGGGVLMMGDGINDAPALAAAHVGVAVASSPRDLVAAASDVIVLNGQGAAALPWLLRMAHRTQAVVRQNLTLALASMAFATLPTVAGFFPLWLAVLLHEGSTLAVALNSLRLLLPEPDERMDRDAAGSGSSKAAGAAAAEAAGHRADGGRSPLAEVWRGLCDLAAPEPGGSCGHHHHHHHDHHHGHHHGHHSEKAKAQGLAHPHAHDHGHAHGHGHHRHHDDHHEHEHVHHHSHAQGQGQGHRHGPGGTCCGGYPEHEEQAGQPHGHSHSSADKAGSNGSNGANGRHDHPHPHPHPGQQTPAPQQAAGGGELIRANRPQNRDVSASALPARRRRQPAAAAAAAHPRGHFRNLAATAAAAGPSPSSASVHTLCCCGGRGWHGGVRLGPLAETSAPGTAVAAAATATATVTLASGGPAKKDMTSAWSGLPQGGSSGGGGGADGGGSFGGGASCVEGPVGLRMRRPGVAKAAAAAAAAQSSTVDAMEATVGETAGWCESC